MQKPAALVSALVLLLAAGIAAAQESAGAVDPKAVDVVRQMSAHVAMFGTFRFRVFESADRLDADGQKIQFSGMRQIRVARPNRLHVIAEGDIVNQEFWYDGTSMALHDRSNNTFASAEAPPSLTALASLQGAPLAELFLPDATDALLRSVQSGKDLGIHHVGSIRCFHVAFRTPDIDWQLWAESGMPSLPRKMVITYKTLPGQPQYTAVFSEWSGGENYTAESFAFTPPEGAVKAEGLAPALPALTVK